MGSSVGLKPPFRGLERCWESPGLKRMMALIEQHRAALTALCRRFKVRRLDLFGSAAKGTFDP